MRLKQAVDLYEEENRANNLIGQSLDSAFEGLLSVSLPLLLQGAPENGKSC